MNPLGLLAYAASAWISTQYAGGFWVVGPVFGLAVVVSDSQGLKSLQPVKHVLFIALSTLIYALVYRISLLKWGADNDLYNYVIGSFPVAIVTGSVLMAFMHSVVLNKSKDLMVRAAVSLVVCYYAITLLMYVAEKEHLNVHVPWLGILITAWQGMYLYTFFGKSKA